MEDPVPSPLIDVVDADATGLTIRSGYQPTLMVGAIALVLGLGTMMLSASSFPIGIGLLFGLTNGNPPDEAFFFAFFFLPIAILVGGAALIGACAKVGMRPRTTRIREGRASRKAFFRETLGRPTSVLIRRDGEATEVALVTSSGPERLVHRTLNAREREGDDPFLWLANRVSALLDIPVNDARAEQIEADAGVFRTTVHESRQLYGQLHRVTPVAPPHESDHHGIVVNLPDRTFAMTPHSLKIPEEVAFTDILDVSPHFWSGYDDRIRGRLAIQTTRGVLWAGLTKFDISDLGAAAELNWLAETIRHQANIAQPEPDRGEADEIPASLRAMRSEQKA